MYYRNHNRLFSQNDINSYLQASSASLEAEIKSLTLETINSTGEQKLTAGLAEKYTVNNPVLSEDEIKIDAYEGEVEVYGQCIFDDERRSHKTSGLRISVSVPFRGNSELFSCRASTYSLSGTPEAEVEEQILVLRYETAEKDPEKIKGLWRSDIRTIKQNLEWLGKDITNHNNSLGSNIRTLVTKRKKEAEDNQSLIDKIKS